MRLELPHELQHKHALIHGYCKTCKKNDTELYHCEQCMIGVYCSTKCQKEDYKEHALICGRDDPRSAKKKRVFGDEGEPSLFSKLPRDVLLLILQQFSLNELKEIRKVSKVLAKHGAIKMLREFTFVVKSLRDIQAISKGLKEYITRLRFDDAFNQPVTTIKWPPNIKRLTFGNSFNQPVDNLPSSIIHLQFGNNFNQPVNNLPSNITYLQFGDNFNQPVDNLPVSITHLKFGDEFNQLIDKLPPNIIYLATGHRFNQPVNNLPQSISYLDLGYNHGSFNQSLDKLPKSVEHLAVGIDFKFSEHNIPKNITTLTTDMDIGMYRLADVLAQGFTQMEHSEDEFYR